jgi:hypothetical protein
VFSSNYWQCIFLKPFRCNTFNFVILISLLAGHQIYNFKFELLFCRLISGFSSPVPEHNVAMQADMNSVADRASGFSVNSQSWADTKSILPSDGTFPHNHPAGGFGVRRGRTYFRLTLQGKIYNFLERPTGWKCFVYHFTV